MTDEGSVGGAGGRAILYARVSTEEQARHGYSLRRQLDVLRDHAAHEGHDVVEEAADPGQTGATLERPGIERVRELVAAGEAAVVFAQDIDRVSREPWHYEYLKAWLEDHGAELRLLNDDGADGTPMGEFVAYVRRGVAKLERADIARRTVNGKIGKAREGKVVAPGRPKYGFEPDASGVGSVGIDEEKMGVVRRIFRMAAEGASLRSVGKTFDREGIPTPGGGRFWDRSFIKTCIGDDAYRPHTIEEVRALVPPGVADGLDPNKPYGISWYNRRGLVKKRASEPFGSASGTGNGAGGGNGQRYHWYHKPEKEHVAVPVPDAGISRELVDAARAAVAGNRRPSQAGHRFWELSGGFALCAECGRRMSHRHTPWVKKNGKRYEYYYYRCSEHNRHGPEGCQNSISAHADELEALAWGRVSDFLKRPERLEDGLNRLVEQERKDLLTGGSREREAERLEKKIAAAERERANYHRMAARDLISFENLAERINEVDAAQAAARDELRALSRGGERLQRLEQDRDALLQHYKTIVPSKLDALPPERRRRVHAALGTEVLVSQDGSIEVRLQKVRMTLPPAPKHGAENDPNAPTPHRYTKSVGSSTSARMAGP